MFRFSSFKNRDFKRTEIQQHDLTDCGAACLAAVSAYYKLEVPIAKIRQIAYTDQKGTNLLGMIEAAKQLGFDAKGVKVSDDQIAELPGPCIAHVVVRGRLHHYVVILKTTEKEVTMMDPAHGKIQTVSAESFFTIWTNVILLLEPGESFEEKNEKYSVAKRFWFLLKPYTFIFTQILIGSVFAVILGLATSLYIQKIIDNVIPNDNGNLLNLMGVLMICIILFSAILGHFKGILTLQTGQKIDAKLILGYYKHLLNLPQQFFDNMRTGEIISRINDAVKIRAFINDVIVGFVVNIFVLIFSFTLMFIFYWKLALLMIVVIPLYIVIYIFSNKVNKKTQRELMENSADLEAQLVESLNAVSTIKRFGIEDYTNIKTEGRFINLLKSIYESGTNSIWIGNLSGLVTSVFTVALLWIGTSFVLQNELTAGELLSFYAIMGYFTGPVASFISMNKTIQDSLIAADRLFEIMDIETDDNEGKIQLDESQIGNIAFKDVVFSYGSRNQVFNGLDLEIETGKFTAIIGQSGSGKSTLTSIIQKVYPITSGRVYIGNQNLEYIHSGSLKKMIGVVPQQIHLFAGNIVENIAVGDFYPDMDRVLSICQDLGILTFIEALPQGFKTYIGENGVSLSGGQRQRLAIARALYKDPSILIFDEATSALDSESEAFTLKTLHNLKDQGKTVIMIAHRLSSVVGADQILVMDQGQLIETGAHEQLMADKGVYHEMWKKQMPDYKLEDNS
ncbi:peptidase domain-containing ABC transporter [Belliella kenyensis]|uniref:Peptidase domain-containing ABC transporter n=1 Tax=Belliella kenyensis TaxID=1472724 RepID=A0ABV8EFF8_9BACT|nr:peptidase domain-containing ABC transporter [Belliella kenyensis]MCH7401172.1 peptidase domain-containing ABC transporter [Belliella kenyensis]MDN3604169.1 peptidase domain-containing ABC transporter [Belliella kenyensis]